MSTTNNLTIAPRSDGPTEKPTRGTYCIGTTRTGESDSQNGYHTDEAYPMLTTGPVVLSEDMAKATKETVGATPKKNVNQTGEDHNWRRHVPRNHHTKEAVFDENRPNLKPGKTRKVDVNKHTIAKSVGNQVSERTDGRPVTDKMNRFIAEDLRFLHQSTWTRIRDKEPLPCQTNTTQGQSESKPVIAEEIIRKITTTYEIADWAPKIPLPRRANGAHAPMEAIEENPTLHADRAEARETYTLAEWTEGTTSKYKSSSQTIHVAYPERPGYQKSSSLQSQDHRPMPPTRPFPGQDRDGTGTTRKRTEHKG